MKKQFLFISLFAVTILGAFAQIPAGTKYIGGSLGFGSGSMSTTTSGIKEDDIKNSSFNVSPEFGYFIKDNLSVGVFLDYGNATITNNNPGGNIKTIKTKTPSFGGVVYGRKFFNVGERFHLFAGLDLGYETSNSVETTTLEAGGSTEDTYKANTMSFSVNGGMAYSLSDKWTLVGKWAPGLGYSTTNGTITYAGITTTTDVKSSQFGLNVNTLGNPFNVGLYYSF
jgi:hypothetical protein